MNQKKPLLSAAHRKLAEDHGVDPDFAAFVYAASQTMPPEFRPYKTIRECILMTAVALAQPEAKRFRRKKK